MNVMMERKVERVAGEVVMVDERVPVSRRGGKNGSSECIGK